MLPSNRFSRYRSALLLLPLLLVFAAAAKADRESPPTGSYAIADAADLQQRGLYHFLYLHPSGKFFMAAEWAGNESSRAAGTWAVASGLITLTGTARVHTNQGSWEVPYRRSFHIEAGAPGRTRLVPVLEKNRFGMLGWPNAYEFVSSNPEPPFPTHVVPADPAALLALIDGMVPPTPTVAKP